MSRARVPRRQRDSVPRVPLPLAAIPRATYRVQLHRDFTFADLTALVPYLASLGISHVYCSPYLRARPGSRHGYDIVDHRMLNPEIGSEKDFAQLVAELARHGMSHLCDIVPNHMAIMGEDNAWWMDVLENGRASAYADYFDIDWTPQDPVLAGKVLVPVLGDAYAKVLERGELKLTFEADTGTFAVRYFEHRFPLDPRDYPRLLDPALAAVRETLDAVSRREAERLLALLRRLPTRDAPARASMTARRAAAALLKRQLAALAARHPPLAAAIASAVQRINGIPGDESSLDALHALLEAQAYRLAHWRVASDEINYRRFFDVNDLAALRMENAPVFEATHAYVLGLAARGAIGGLRIDHPDGLFDPAHYFSQLQKRYGEMAAAAGRQSDAPQPGIYVVVEKISAPHERLPAEWPIHGSTGYRFCNLVNGLFVDGRAKSRVDRIWRAFAGAEADTLDAQAYRGRRVIMERALASELGVLTSRALRIARAERRSRDITFNALREAIKETVAHFPVYRTYVDAAGPSEHDRRHVDWALSRARARSLTADAGVFAFLRDLLLGTAPDPGAGNAAAYLDFAMRFQQFTSPVAAKGIEDTAFYTFNRLVALNEVGGDPEQFGTTVRAFHRASATRIAAWPHTMLATSTHDNKRSEDVRARIDVISEMPALWRMTVRRWRRLNRSRGRLVDDEPAPSRNDEYLLYQTLIGSFPPEPVPVTELAAYRERIEQYMVKAAREAKVRTSWLAVNSGYEDALTEFVAGILRESGDNRFLDELRTQSATFAWFGLLNSLSMTLLKLTSPGVPDIYQGNELLDYSLVDPDNRRPVDYARRREFVDALVAARNTPNSPVDLRALLTSPYDGRAKLWLILRTLALRRVHPDLFAYGDYQPVDASGTGADHVVAFARRHGAQGMVAVAGRLFLEQGLEAGQWPVGEFWQDTALGLPFIEAGSIVTDVLSGEAVDSEGMTDWPLARLCRNFPVALLHFAPAAAPA